MFCFPFFSSASTRLNSISLNVLINLSAKFEWPLELCSSIPLSFKAPRISTLIPVKLPSSSVKIIFGVSPIFWIPSSIPAKTSGESLALIGSTTAYLLKMSIITIPILVFCLSFISFLPIKNKSTWYSYPACGATNEFWPLGSFFTSTFSLKNCSTSFMVIVASFFLLSLRVVCFEPNPAGSL